MERYVMFNVKLDKVNFKDVQNDLNKIQQSVMDIFIYKAKESLDAIKNQYDLKGEVLLFRVNGAFGGFIKPTVMKYKDLKKHIFNNFGLKKFLLINDNCTDFFTSERFYYPCHKHGNFIMRPVNDFEFTFFNDKLDDKLRPPPDNLNVYYDIGYHFLKYKIPIYIDDTINKKAKVYIVDINEEEKQQIDKFTKSGMITGIYH